MTIVVVDHRSVRGAIAYVEANAAFSLAAQWTVSGAVGHQSLDVNADYATWNAGVAYAFTDHVAIDVRYHDTDVDGPLSGDRVVGALKFLFSCLHCTRQVGQALHSSAPDRFVFATWQATCAWLARKLPCRRPAPKPCAVAKGSKWRL